MVDLLEGESEDMERSFWVVFEDADDLLHLLVDLRVTIITQELLKDFRKLADDLDILEGDIQLGDGLCACKLDYLHKFPLHGLVNGFTFQQFEDLAEEVVLLYNFCEKILEGGVGKAFPELPINEDMVEDYDVDYAEVGK